jgi:hypothetical protein
MKNTIKVFGFAALVAVIGFAVISMIGCPAPDNGTNGNEGGTLDGQETFTAAPALTIEPDNGKITYTWTASEPAADSYDVFWKAGSGLSAADVKTGTKITGATSGGEITGLTNGTTYSVIVSANKASYTSADSAVQTATPASVYVITGSGAAFTAKKGASTIGTADQPIQAVIEAVRADANGDASIIRFGDGTAVLDIGDATASFNNTGGTWGAVTLQGKITSSAAVTVSGTDIIGGTIAIADNVSITSAADIANTDATMGLAINSDSTGGLTITGGAVQAMIAAVYNVST